MQIRRCTEAFHACFESTAGPPCAVHAHPLSPCLPGIQHPALFQHLPPRGKGQSYFRIRQSLWLCNQQRQQDGQHEKARPYMAPRSASDAVQCNVCYKYHAMYTDSRELGFTNHPCATSNSQVALSASDDSCSRPLRSRTLHTTEAYLQTEKLTVQPPI